MNQDWWKTLACCGAQQHHPDLDKNPRGRMQSSMPNASPSSHLQAKYHKQAGVGIIFQKQERPDPRGLLVERCSTGGPAENTRRIHHGMILVAIDGADIRGLPAAKIAPLIIGPLGSEVDLHFMDGDMSETKVVRLTRGILV